MSPSDPYGRIYGSWIKALRHDHSALVVLTVLMLFHRGTKGAYVYPSTKTIMDYTGLGRNAIRRALKRISLLIPGVIRVNDGTHKREFYIEIPTGEGYTSGPLGGHQRPLGALQGAPEGSLGVSPGALQGAPVGLSREPHLSYEERIEENTYIPRQNSEGEDAVPRYPVNGVYTVAKEDSTRKPPTDQQTSPGIKSKKARATNYVVDGERLAGLLSTLTKRPKVAEELPRWAKFAERYGGYDAASAIIFACLANPQSTAWMNSAMSFKRVNQYAIEHWDKQADESLLDPRFM